jgi:type 1 fimbriae regulatory protein FimB/type 1 fimbriae regulatory protein FimE
MHVLRLKGSDDSVHTLEADETSLLGKLRKQQPDSEFVFLSERGTPMSADNFLKLVKRLGKKAGLSVNVHPHMLRHGAGFALVQKGAGIRHIQAFLGHRNVQNTVLYTKLASDAFKSFGRMIGGRV